MPLLTKAIISKKMRNILSDSNKFTQVSVSEDKQLNFIVNVEKHITDILKDLKNSEVIPEIIYKSLKPRSSRFGSSMVFVKSTNSWLITAHLLNLLWQQSKHLHII